MLSHSKPLLSGSALISAFVLAHILIFVGIVPTARSAQLGADDFLPLAQTQSAQQKQDASQIQDPAGVKLQEGMDGKPAVVAASAQDAINAASKRVPEGGGCEQIIFPSGFGWVASGVSVYTLMDNPTATLHAQRLAYQNAYLQAKKNLAQALTGLTTTGMNQLENEMRQTTTGTDNLANTSSTSTESIKELVDGMLRGYVVYSVDDTPKDKHGQVTVVIVTTPKTMGKYGRPDPTSLTAGSVRSGLEYVLSELSTGLLPPVGGKTISVPQTGELAFVGFGTAVVSPNENPAVQAKLALDAQKIAAMRARSALCGIIIGDKLMATSSLDTATQELSRQFDEMEKEDPVTKEKSKKYNKLNEQKQNFLQTQLSSEQVTSIRAGVLPPGVTTRTYFNESKTVVEAVAVFLPSITAKAGQAANAMRESQIIQPEVSTSTTQSFSNSQNTTLDTSKGIGGGTVPAKGPSGQVSKDGDL